MRILQGDCLDILPTIESDSVDSIVTDPPYELGFMGKKWDNTGIAYNVKLWQECLRVLKPGGHLLAFGGTRTYHRMACAIEDAGFEVRDMIEWVYGSGFPKSLNIGKAVDQLQGNERVVTQISKQLIKDSYREMQGRLDRLPETFNYTKGNSAWEGWGTALKPAHEPICLARKPLSEKTIVENVLKHGTGGINIDGCRIEGEGWHRTNKVNAGIATHKNKGWGMKQQAYTNCPPSGRFPTNFIHDGSDEVKECFPNTNSSYRPSGKRLGKGTKGNVPIGPTLCYSDRFEGYDDSGNAARYFKSIIYTSKTSPSERSEVNNHHCTVKPIKLMEYLIKMVTPPNGTVLDPFLGSGTTAVACVKLGFDCIGIDKESEYIEIINRRITHALDNLEELEPNLLDKTIEKIKN